MSTIKKFSYDHFKMLDTGDLFINIWSYSDNLKNVCKKKCKICNIYRQYCSKNLKERWEEEWGDFYYILKKIYNNDIDNFIDMSQYSSAEKHLIMEDLKIIQRAKF